MQKCNVRIANGCEFTNHASSKAIRKFVFISYSYTQKMPPQAKQHLLYGYHQFGYFFPFLSSDTVNFLRPRFLRAATTLRPLADSMRSRKPCLFFLLRFEG
jgi:hypothetical protein